MCLPTLKMPNIITVHTQNAHVLSITWKPITLEHTHKGTKSKDRLNMNMWRLHRERVQQCGSTCGAQWRWASGWQADANPGRYCFSSWFCVWAMRRQQCSNDHAQPGLDTPQWTSVNWHDGLIHPFRPVQMGCVYQSSPKHNTVGPT